MKILRIESQNKFYKVHKDNHNTVTFKAFGAIN